LQESAQEFYLRQQRLIILLSLAVLAVVVAMTDQRQAVAVQVDFVQQSRLLVVAVL
jgi:hypothetical protein